jgi:protocatechuate 3,4-dioxygenase beta subunit
MHGDDHPVGRILTRREALALLSLSGAGWFVGCRPGARDAERTSASSTSASETAEGALPSCVVRPEQTEGPYFVDELLRRSDIRSDPSTGEMRPGTPLEIEFQVSQIQDGRCAPLADARVDVWHCDAAGIYSDVNDPGFDTSGQKFLRGYQDTGKGGVARFTTIYPGWYRGRAVHVHFKIRTPSANPREFTSQLYFDDALTDRVHARVPYARHASRDTRNSDDFIFSRGGDRLTLALAESDAGFASRFEIALDLT